MIRNLIRIEDVTTQWWDGLYSTFCDILEHPNDYVDACRGKVMASLFFEPSTRTSFSFQSAMQRLGGGVFGFTDPATTSASKGETLADTIRVVSAYSDAVVIRSKLEGAAQAAALYSTVPVVNAGDGGHQHPTQTLTDLATIAQLRGKIGGITIGLCGDLKYGRTVHSLVMALEKFDNVRFVLITPPELKMPDYMLDHMRRTGQNFTEVTSLEDTLPELDVLYMTRIQRERFPDYNDYLRLRGVYVLTKDKLRAAKSDMTILHPLPRYDEMGYDVDDDPRAKYFDQVRYGMLIRMALLANLCNQKRETPHSHPLTTNINCTNPICVTSAEPYLPRLLSLEGGQSCGYCDKSLI